MNDGKKLVETVRLSVDRTREEHTARLRYQVHARRLWPPRAGRSNLRDRPLLGGIDLPGPLGQIDLQRDRALYGSAGSWHFFVDGTSYLGAPGEWELDDEDLALGENEPQWLIALIAACVEANELGEYAVRGVRCRCLELKCDFGQVRLDGERLIRPPFVRDGLDLARLDVDIGLDPLLRIRKAAFFNGRARTVFELDDFSAVPPIERPDNSEILPEQ